MDGKQQNTNAIEAESKNIEPQKHELHGNNAAPAEANLNKLPEMGNGSPKNVANQGEDGKIESAKDVKSSEQRNVKGDDTNSILGEGGTPTPIKYSQINPCDEISREVAESFSGATFTKRVLTEDTVMYRVSGGNAKEVGSYMSMTPQGGGLQSQLDLALNPAWGNTTENVTKVVVPKGTTIYEGIAAPQNIYMIVLGM